MSLNLFSNTLHERSKDFRHQGLHGVGRLLHLFMTYFYNLAFYTEVGDD